jgi:ferredoxin, 2Fe-2S
MYAVKINFKKDIVQQRVSHRARPGQTLLELCLNKKIDLQFNCGGVCSCSTCHIIVEKGEKFLEQKSRREIDFIKKAKNVQQNSRLACQCVLLDDAGEIEITIPEKIELT